MVFSPRFYKCRSASRCRHDVVVRIYRLIQSARQGRRCYLPSGYILGIRSHHISRSCMHFRAREIAAKIRGPGRLVFSFIRWIIRRARQGRPDATGRALLCGLSVFLRFRLKMGGLGDWGIWSWGLILSGSRQILLWFFLEVGFYPARDGCASLDDWHDILAIVLLHAGRGMVACGTQNRGYTVGNGYYVGLGGIERLNQTVKVVYLVASNWYENVLLFDG